MADNAEMERPAAPGRNGRSRDTVTGTLTGAFAFSVVIHAVLAGLMGVPNAADVSSARQMRFHPLLARLQAPSRPDAEFPAAPEPPPVRSTEVPDSASRRQPADQANSAVDTPAQSTVARVIAPSGPIAAPVTARYYLPREVDQPAAPLEHAPLLYPEEALKQRIGGVVVMHLFIGADGRLERTEVVRAEPPGLFEQAVRDAAQASRFRPALLGRLRVNSRVTIEVPFDPDCSDFMTCLPPPGRG